MLTLYVNTIGIRMHLYGGSIKYFLSYYKNNQIRLVSFWMTCLRGGVLGYA